MDKLYYDIETYSELDLKVVGSYKYAENCKILLIAYAFNDDPVKIWDATTFSRIPTVLEYRLSHHAWEKIGFNSMLFDRVVIRKQLGITIPVTRSIDVMHQARLLGYPSKLSRLCEALNLSESQAKKHSDLMFSKPIKTKDNPTLHRLMPNKAPDLWRSEIEYAKRDVEVTRTIHKMLPTYNYSDRERLIISLDTAINDRGMMLDVDLIDKVDNITVPLKESAASEILRLSNGVIKSPTQRVRIRKFIQERFDYAITDTKAATIRDIIDDKSLPSDLRDFLGLLQFSGTSQTKGSYFKNRMSSDHRLRGSYMYYGALRTGRWASFGLQNLPRPTIDEHLIDTAIDAIKGDYCSLLFDNLTDVTKSVVRSMFIAGEGNKFVVSDLANIEGRIAVWLANDTKKIKAFELYDRGEGPDLYKLCFSEMFNIPILNVDSFGRTVGKVLTLSLGFGAGVSALARQFITFGIDIADMVKNVQDIIPARYKVEVDRRFIVGTDITDHEAIILNALKNMWRDSNNGIVKLWYSLENCAKISVGSGVASKVSDRLHIDMDNGSLRVRLPSGRFIVYPRAKISGKGEITFSGIGDSGRFVNMKTYGASIFENVCQGIARDILADNMILAEGYGYKIVGHTHDDAIAETPCSGSYSAEHFSKILATNSNWNKGLPLSAEGFETLRLRKG